MTKYVAIQDLDLSKVKMVDQPFDLKIEGSDLVCIDPFGEIVAKYPFDKTCKYRINHGIPSDVTIDENGNAISFDVDFEDFDSEYEEYDLDCHKNYGWTYTQNFTLVIEL